MDELVKQLATYSQPAIIVVGTIALFFSGRSKYKQDVSESILQASATWHDVAEARKERILQLTQENDALKQEITRLRAPITAGGAP